jgi:hypothetical protein
MKITGVSKRPGDWVMLNWEGVWFKLKENTARIRLPQVGGDSFLPNSVHSITAIHPTYKSPLFLTA